MEWVLGILLVAGALSFLLGLWALRTGRAAKLIETQLKAQLYDACRVDLRFVALEVEPFSARAHLGGLELYSEEGRRLLAVGEAFADLSLMALLQGRVEVTEVVLDRPYAEIRVRNGDLIDLPQCARRSGNDGRTTPLGLNEVELMRGRFRIGLESAELTLDGVHAGLWPAPTGGSNASFAIREGRLVTATSSASGLSIATLANVVPLQGFDAVGHIEGAALSPRSIRLDRLQVSFGGLELDASGAFDFIDRVLAAKLLLQSRLDRIPAVIPAWPELSGTAEVQVALRSEGLDLGVDVDLSLAGVAVNQRHLGRELRLKASADRSGVDIKELYLALERGEATARGRVDFSEGLPVRLEADADKFSFASLMDALGNQGFWVDFAVTGPTTVRGTLAPLELVGPFEFAIPGLTVWDGPWDDETVTRDPDRVLLDVVPIDIAGRWRFTASDFEVITASLRTERSRGRASTRIRHQGRQTVVVDAELDYLDFADLGEIAGVSLLGVGPVSGRLEGPIVDLSARGAIGLDGISISGIPLGRATAEVLWDGRYRLDVNAIEGQIADTSWHGDVGILFQGAVPVRLKGEISGGQVGDLLLPLGFEPAQAAALRGGIRGRFDLSGPIATWNGPLSLELSKVRAFGQPLGSGRARGYMEKGRVLLKALNLNRGRARSSARGWFQPGSTQFNLNARMEGWRWSDVVLAESIPTVSGSLGARVRLEGKLLSPVGDMVLDLENTHAGPLVLGSGELAMALNGGRAAVAGSLPRAGIALSGELSGPLERLPFDVILSLDNAPLPVWIGAELGAAVEGQTSAQVELRGDLLRPLGMSGRIRLEDVKFETVNRTFDLRAPRALILDRGALQLDPLTIRARDFDLELNKVARLDGSLNLEVSGEVGLPFVSELVPLLERPSGQIAFRGKVDRIRGKYEVRGEAALDGGAFQWPGIPNRISDISGKVTFSQASLFVEEASARWAGGRLFAEGSAALVDLVPSGLDMTIAVSGVRPRLPMPYLDLTGRMDGRLALGGTWPSLTARGRLEVTESRVRPRTDLSQLVGLRGLTAAYDPTAEVIELDIGLGLDDPMRIRNDDIDVSLRGELQLTGTNERVGLLGSLSLLRGGRVSFLGRNYLADGGLIEMRERYEVSPRYDLSVSTQACDAQITLNLVGDLTEVQTGYASNPEMANEDITSCLIRGIKRQELDQDLAMASFAGSALLKLSGVDRQVKRVIPIDQLDVTTEFSSRTRAYEPRVWVAKDLYLLDRPVRLEYSTSLLRNDDQRAAFRVSLTPRLSLQLGWTSSEDVPTGDWGLDLERRWEW